MPLLGMHHSIMPSMRLAIMHQRLSALLSSLAALVFGDPGVPLAFYDWLPIVEECARV